MSSTLSRPSETAVSSRGSIVSRPGYPGGGSCPSFSSSVWGAAGWGWSLEAVPMTFPTP